MTDPSFWRGRRVLVTGHTGFKGAWLTLWLQRLGADVSGFSRDVPTEPSLYALAGIDVRETRGDIRDAQAVSRAVAPAEVVFHLAAQPLVRRSFQRPRETYDVNVMGTAAVLDAVREHGTPATVIVTSDKCYDNREQGEPFTEDAPLGGHDPYSSSKAAAELVTDAYRRSFELPVASARAGNVIGGGDWGEDRLIPDILRAAEAGQAVRIRNPAAVRPWQHVLNPLSGYLLLAERLHGDARFAQAWNFGPDLDDARPVQWVVERIAERWEADPGPHPHEARFLALDSTKARETLGWAPRWDLEQALARITEWTAAEDKREITLRQIDAFQA
jgi:CDP-glucose 4,6-dehydratase